MTFTVTPKSSTFDGIHFDTSTDSDLHAFWTAFRNSVQGHPDVTDSALKAVKNANIWEHLTATILPIDDANYEVLPQPQYHSVQSDTGWAETAAGVSLLVIEKGGTVDDAVCCFGAEEDV